MSRRGARGKKRSSYPALSFEQLYEGYDKSIQNAERLLGAGTQILEQYSDVAIGLYELGQEEIGRSFSFLAAFGYLPSDPQWGDFWETWRDHRTKAYRAFFCEWFSPTRVVVSEELDGFPRKASIEHEKEASFYVDFLKDTKRFVSPGEQVDAVEVFNRSSMLMSHFVTASYMRFALDAGDKVWNYQTFSVLPALILTRKPRQERMPAIIDRFAMQSDRHRELVDTLRQSLRNGAAWLREVHSGKPKPPSEGETLQAASDAATPENQ